MLIQALNRNPIALSPLKQDVFSIYFLVKVVSGVPIGIYFSVEQQLELPDWIT